MNSKRGELFTAGAIIAGASCLLLARSFWKRKSNRHILIFEDGGEQSASGLVAEAVSISSLSLNVQSAASLRLAAGKALGFSQPERSRLWVQATKSEVTDHNLQNVLSDTHGLSAVVLICTKDNEELSCTAKSCESLKRFPSGPLPLPILGNALALRTGPHEIPAFNAYENLIKGRKEKTVRIHLPFEREGQQEGEYNIDYNPMKLEGLIHTTDVRIVQELLDRQDAFPKKFTNMLQRKVQEFVEKGLFTVSTSDKTWETGHGVLPKFFNAIRIKNYFPVVLAKTQVFVREWYKLGNGANIHDVNDWLTCMTADAVTKASMDYDMHNVEKKGAHEDLHPFISAFRFGLGFTIGNITAMSKFGWLNSINPFFRAKSKMEAIFEEAKATCREIVSDITESTRKGEIGGPLSFISAMLHSKASTNGEFVRLDDFYGHMMNIMIAGHETTAATLGFCLAELARNPDCLAKVVAEIKEVMGNRVSPTYDDTTSVPYLDACFRETLRLYPPVQFVIRDCAQDTILPGNYMVRKGQRVQINVYGLHRDPDQWDQGVFGDPHKFNPDRHMAGAPPRHPSAMIPFGFGLRACLGMQFALLEARTFMMMILNYFSFQLPPNFKLVPSLKEGGAAPSPKGLTWTLSFRPGGPLSCVDIFNTETTTLQHSTASICSKQSPSVKAKKDRSPLLVLYGSNSGTCEDFAQEVASRAGDDGYPVSVTSLDSAEEEKKLPYTAGPVIIVTSTYNGMPPGNAAAFAKWLDGNEKDSLEGMHYAVFGVGNSDWESTFQQFPTQVHRGLAASGATQMLSLTTVDVNEAGFVEVFDRWATKLIAVLGIDPASVAVTKAETKRKTCLQKVDPATFKDQPMKSVIEVVSYMWILFEEYAQKANDRDLSALVRRRKPFRPSVVTKLVQLQSEYSNRSTCHLELELPEAMRYQGGDHLELLGSNNEEIVKMALDVLGLEEDDPVEMIPALCVFFKGYPMDVPNIPVTSKLALSYVPDLSAPPSRRVLQSLADACSCPPEAAELRALCQDRNYAEKVLNDGVTLTEILAKYRSVNMDVEEFCASHPRLKPRFYSISSSPLVNPRRVSITVGLVDYVTKTGRQHLGAASHIVHSLDVGSPLLVRVTSLNSKFKLPEDSLVPIIMVGPGTGVAPFMGFLEERDVLREQGKQLGTAHLFFGCRDSSTDFLYKGRLEKYTNSGVLSHDGLHVAFSQKENHNRVYVQDLIAEMQEKIWNLIVSGAIVYVCGDAKRMAPDVKKSFMDIAVEAGDMAEAAAKIWLGSLVSSGRYIEDVYS